MPVTRLPPKDQQKLRRRVTITTSFYALKAAVTQLQVIERVPQVSISQNQQQLGINLRKCAVLLPLIVATASFNAPVKSVIKPSRKERLCLPASRMRLKKMILSGDPLEWPEWSGCLYEL